MRGLKPLLNRNELFFSFNCLKFNRVFPDRKGPTTTMNSFCRCINSFFLIFGCGSSSLLETENIENQTDVSLQHSSAKNFL